MTQPGAAQGLEPHCRPKQADYVKSADDALNEYLIAHTYTQMMASTDDAGRRRWCDRLTHYVGRRSPELIAAMEAEKGLA